jgi:hypothetical protein
MHHKLREDELEILSDLQRAGVPLDLELLGDFKASSRGLSVFQTGSPVENTVSELDSGGSGYMLSVAIHNDSNRAVRLNEFRLELLWHDAQFCWLSDPFRASPRESNYSFPTPRSIEFPREVVLNHHLGNAGKLNPGGSFEGLLLAAGEAPIPAEYHDGQILKMRILVFDSQSRCSASHCELWVERRRRNPTQKKIRQSLMRSG